MLFHALVVLSSRVAREGGDNPLTTPRHRRASRVVVASFSSPCSSPRPRPRAHTVPRPRAPTTNQTINQSNKQTNKKQNKNQFTELLHPRTAEDVARDHVRSAEILEVGISDDVVPRVSRAGRAGAVGSIGGLSGATRCAEECAIRRARGVSRISSDAARPPAVWRSLLRRQSVGRTDHERRPRRGTNDDGRGAHSLASHPALHPSPRAPASAAGQEGARRRRVGRGRRRRADRRLAERRQDVHARGLERAKEAEEELREQRWRRRGASRRRPAARDDATTARVQRAPERRRGAGEIVAALQCEWACVLVERHLRSRPSPCIASGDLRMNRDAETRTSPPSREMGRGEMAR